MTMRVRAAINPLMLGWARTQAGFSLEEAVHRLRHDIKATPERLKIWETPGGSEGPSIAQVEHLAHLYDRPAGMFYLSAIPEEPPLPADFRIGSDAGDGYSPELRRAARRIMTLRDYALGMAEDLDELEDRFPEFPFQATLGDNPETVAAHAREWLGVTWETQCSWRDLDGALSGWRAALERSGVLVFMSVGEVPVTEMRGFCLIHERAPAIVVNNYDRKSARVFTVFHELGHIILRKDALCRDLDGDEHSSAVVPKTEAWCNRFAGAFLVPEGYLNQLPDRRGLVAAVTEQAKDPYGADRFVRSVAKGFSVSPEVLVRRLAVTRAITTASYLTWRSGYYLRNPEAKKPVPTNGKRTGPPPEIMMPYRFGSKFTTLTLSAYWNDRLTLRDLCDVFRTKVETVQRVENAMKLELMGLAHA